MAKKKNGRNPRNALESTDRKLIGDAFDDAIRFARKNSSHPNVPKIYDLVGPILKRRKAAVYNLLPEIRKRFGSLYENLDTGLLTAWINECSALNHSVDGVDHLYYITLAAAIFMLDELKHDGRLPAAYCYFNSSQEALMSVRLPDIYDPCHEEIVLRGVMELIRERDPRDNPFQAYINDVSAQRTEPVAHQKPEQDLGSLSPRERFNAVMALVPSVVKERAMKRFIEKYWEFLGIFFACDAPLCKKQTELLRQSDSIMSECRKLHKRLVEKREEKKSPNIPRYVLAPKAALPFQELQDISGNCGMSRAETFAIGEMDRLQALAAQGLAMEDAADDAGRRRFSLALFAHSAQMVKQEDLIENLDADIAECLLRFEVNDPYETCFGYLCLIEAGSDIPWTYNAAVAVLVAAARKLPWNARALDEQDNLTDGFDEESNLEHQHKRADADFARDEDIVPIDWNDRKADLYRLNYLNTPLYAPLESSVPDWKLNIPQILYGLTGIVMPRTVSDSDGMAEVFEAAGVEKGTAKGLELYLQIALDIQMQSRDWRHDFRHPSAALPKGLSDSDAENAVNIDKEDDIDELKAKIRRLRESNEKYREDLYQIRREMEMVKERTENVEKRAAAERTELAELRELVFTQANAVEMGGPEPDKAAELRFPYSTRKRVVAFGGHDSWRKAIRPLLPNVTFINREQRPNADMIKAADVVWIQPNALSHRSFYKIINVVRTNQVPIRYFGYASAMKCAVQVLEDDASDGKS